MPETAQKACPSCGSDDVSTFYEVKDVPVHSCVLLPTRQEALEFPRRDISLGFCNGCGFIYNVIFDSSVQDYGTRYEDQQCFSATFNAFADDLARRLIEKHGLRDKDIVEIGCGKGDFLILLCEKGNNRGLGIDPACEPERIKSSVSNNIKIVRDYYSEKYGKLEGDFICCRHTLEHISATSAFVGSIRRSMGSDDKAVVFFEVPDVIRVLRELAFWDIYYEHCSYFSPGSLARLFRHCGFEVIDLQFAFSGQYLLLEAVPSAESSNHRHPLEESVQQLQEEVHRFSANCRRQVDAWRDKLVRMKTENKTVAVWGSGSKCVAFLTSLGVTDEVQHVVDINPHRHGLFLPTVAKKIESPDSLKEYGPDVVVAMNSIYQREIEKTLAAMGLSPEILSV